ncbi:hypothetical protein T01_2460 [Trichinella spiralis]|uniref:Uncharacterized protein n=1 Tax=Trichinella spiralis TaxID=6334 RepID=A0A0V1BFJ7_TRISP|nr:hypothetical protein T01_2460 [Trichinella spiralis]
MQCPRDDTVGNNMKYEYEIATYNLRNEISFTFLKNQIVSILKERLFQTIKKRRFPKIFYLSTFGEK